MLVMRKKSSQPYSRVADSPFIGEILSSVKPSFSNLNGDFLFLAIFRACCHAKPLAVFVANRAPVTAISYMGSLFLL